jgi:isopenicillin-N N-acyltransferase like protein
MLIRDIFIVFTTAFICLPVNEALSQPLSPQKIFPVLELSGNGYNRGLQHGTQLKNEIAAVFSKWKANIRRNTGKEPDSVLTAFRTATNFEPVTRKYIPAVLDEISGIAEGSGQTYEDVYTFQLVDEFWIYLDKLSNTSNHHCSGIGVPATSNHPAYIAQNMDLENYMQSYQVLLHIAGTANEPEQYIISCAGLVALGGMNGKGIALCLNSLMELQAAEDGLPVAFIIRAVLSKQKGKDAIEFLKTVKHASGQNYIMGIEDSVYNFEASANQVLRFLPKNENAIVYHTNHALVNHDVKSWYENYHQQVLEGETKNRNSEIRFTSLQRRLDKQPEYISTDLIKATLRSKDDSRNPVCRAYREGGGGFTFCSILFTLGGKRSVQLTHGSPDLAEYKEYFFETVPY